LCHRLQSTSISAGSGGFVVVVVALMIPVLPIDDGASNRTRLQERLEDAGTTERKVEATGNVSRVAAMQTSGVRMAVAFISFPVPCVSAWCRYSRSGCSLSFRLETRRRPRTSPGLAGRPSSSTLCTIVLQLSTAHSRLFPCSSNSAITGDRLLLERRV